MEKIDILFYCKKHNVYKEIALKTKKKKIKKSKKNNKFVLFRFNTKINILFVIIIIKFISFYLIFKSFKINKNIINNVNLFHSSNNNINNKNNQSYEIIENYSREESLIRGRNFLDKCLQKLLINKQIFKLSNNIKITAIVPIYNDEKIIKSVIRSIQNQNMTDIEIILVNDFSKDNTLKIIEEMKIEDPRIKIINNEKNKGILYSRSIAVLEAKGKYIINLDQDDFILDEDVFEKVYKEAENGNFDIISFMEIYINNYNAKINEMSDGPFTHHPNNYIVRQPELTYFSFYKDDHFISNDIQIWGKLFRTEVYKNAVNLLGKERYSTYNIINEDLVGLFAICNVAQSYKYFRKYGLFHLINNPTTSSTKVSREHRLEMTIFFTNVIFDLSKNENKKYAAIRVIDLFDVINSLSTKNNSSVEKILKKIITSEYIDDKYKQIIRKKYNRFNF